jgi:hypothetical protein
MANYLTLIAEQLGISVFLLAAIFVWSFVWKLLALWKSARRGSVVWFIVLALINTMGILEILYIFVFSECCKKKPARQRKARKRRR